MVDRSSSALSAFTGHALPEAARLPAEEVFGGEPVYKRVSTDQRSTARQNLALDEVGIEDPVVFEEEPGTSSRLHPLQRPEFRELLNYAWPGDTVHISEMFRLVGGTGHILDVLDVLHRDQIALRIHDGAFSAMDLTARPPRTGELLSTVMFMVQTLAAADELQRDLQRELTFDGLCAAKAKGSKGERRPAVLAAKTADVCASYLEGRTIAAFAGDHGVSRRAIRTAVADLLPDHAAIHLCAGPDVTGGPGLFAPREGFSGGRNWLTAREATELTGVSTVTIYSWVHRGRLKVEGLDRGQKLFRHLRVAQAEVATRVKAKRVLVPAA
ncbi:recombinase family protein [Streptomyces tibetensis]|uniref:recombinase family protein n=1 Tax=Streptomyces tibetensis TaxID=2382123 RepID=UPI0038194839